MPGWQPTRYSHAQLEERRLAALEWIVRDLFTTLQPGQVRTLFERT
ncbi:hypothetical protein DGo_PB0382 (plasmid) [Deinococcus gobiensis I-0]|uniref:Uncharacterized protein n=1 Tax=Deinococcus gobiensis (strain DSM 21396 / JCM 16679 / CGMCC 1.7299 / I-0) TaxID=745776 RepID=H8H2A4_DEIGI|nr:hypothetical protein DGo_PB0382 [Deinococcus gobiensis I-0]